MHQSAFKKAQFFRATYLADYETTPLSLLDVGSAVVDDDTASNRQVLENTNWAYRGLDIEAGRNVDVVVADPYDWSEVSDASVDVVVCSQVFEHTSFFWLTCLEMARVMKTNALALVLAPGSGPLHRYPVDCWRFYDDGLPSVADWAMLTVLDSRVQWRPAYGKGDIWRDAAVVMQKQDLGPDDNIRRQHRIAASKAAYRAEPHSATGSTNDQQVSAIAKREPQSRFEAEEKRLLADRPSFRTKLSLINTKLRDIRRILKTPLERL